MALKQLARQPLLAITLYRVSTLDGCLLLQSRGDRVRLLCVNFFFSQLLTIGK